jgi:hypothetical protein
MSADTAQATGPIQTDLRTRATALAAVRHLSLLLAEAIPAAVREVRVSHREEADLAVGRAIQAQVLQEEDPQVDPEVADNSKTD